MEECKNCEYEIRQVNQSTHKGWFHFYDKADWRNIKICKNPEPEDRRGRK